MTGHAGSRCGRHVRAGESKTRSAVIEGRSRPRDGVVASRTIGRGKGRASSGVCRIIGLLPGRQVAAGVAAIGRLNR